MPTTSGDGLRYPLLSDTPNVPRDLQYLAEDVQGVLTNSVVRRNASVPVSFTSDASINVTGDTNGYIIPPADGAGVGGSFVAPPSGRMLAIVEGRMLAADGAGFYLTFMVRTGATVGSGTIVLNPATNRAATVGGGTLATGERVQAKSSCASLLTGLTPGTTYNAYFVVEQSQAATLAVLLRRLTLIPIA